RLHLHDELVRGHQVGSRHPARGLHQAGLRIRLLRGRGRYAGHDLVRGGQLSGTSPLAQERELIVRNLLNGVPADRVAAAFRRSREEVAREFDFFLRKVRSYAFERRVPPPRVDTLAQATRPENKAVLLWILERLNLATDPAHRRISYAAIEEV